MDSLFVRNKYHDWPGETGKVLMSPQSTMNNLIGAVLVSMLTIVFSLVPQIGSTEGLPPPPVLTPPEQKETFRFAEPGYRIELVAWEPMVQDPVAIRFDGQGRLWVVEMRGYMRDIDRTDPKKPDGRVSVLEDVDGDGQMDRSTIFADDLVLPRSISLHPDGVLIGECEALHFFRDLDGDLKYDRKTLVDNKFARDNIEHSANGLIRGMDNWHYNAKEGHRYRRDGEKWVRDKTEPRGQWGICQDNEGRLFYNYNHSQLYADLVPPNSITRNPNHKPLTGVSVGITNTNRVFPIRPTPAANRAYIPGVLDKEGRIKEFTSACSPLIYRESLFPEFAGNSFVCEVVGNLVKRSAISQDGVYVTGTSIYPDRDFLASTDERFRPCGLEAGPDGAIYIVDMYRGIVQDAPHMSPYLKQTSIERKMETPIHLGRIWRVVPDREIVDTTPPQLDSLDDSELVAMLAHSSGWWRDKAQQYLVEQSRNSAIPALKEMALNHEDELARLHALWTLEGLEDSDTESLFPLLSDNSVAVRAAAIRILFREKTSFSSRIQSLVVEPLPDQVRLQWLLKIGDLSLPRNQKFSLLYQLISPSVESPLMRDALLSSLAGEEFCWLQFFLKELGESPKTPGTSFLVEALTAASLKSEKKRELTTWLTEVPESWLRGTIVATMKFHSPVAVKRKDVIPLTKKQRADFIRGRQVYLATCVACHGIDGKGMQFLAPPLAGSDWVMGSEERLARVLFHGLSGPIHVNGKIYKAPEVQPAMPPLANLNNGDTAAVLTYIRREWGNTGDPVSKNDVNQLRIRAQGRTVPWTEAELEPFSRLKKRD